MIKTFKDRVELFRKDGTRESLVEVLKALDRICESGYRVITPIEVPEDADVSELMPEEVQLQRLSDGNSAYLVAFTTMDELKKGPESAAYYTDLETLMNTALEAPSIEGIVVDPWTSSFIFKNDLIQTLFTVQEQKKVSAHNVSDNFFVHALSPKPLDLIASVRERMPSIPEVKRVFLTGLNNDGTESYLLIVDFEGMEMGELFAKILDTLPVPANGMRIDLTPFAGDVPTAELIYENVF